MIEKNISELPITIYGNLTKFSDTISKARARIFYKYHNRNGTYITDEFADKLLSTIPYTPVKGIYDEAEDDYTDHGVTRRAGRIYGIVPENPNLKWESHIDEDGVERSYACVDVLLFTALYDEAFDIVDKSQSMEIYPPSIKGAWEYIDGVRVYKYTEGSFLGLQILGDDVEPCFEGAAFYNLCDLYNKLSTLVERIETFSLKLPEEKEGGQFKMEKLNFKLSDAQKHEALFVLLNPNYSEEGNWEINYAICDIYDNYAICYNYEELQYERVYYTKDDTNDTVTLGDHVKVYIVDVTESERTALETIQALNGGNYEKIDENFGAVSSFESEKEQYELKIEELNGEVNTLQQKVDDYTTQVDSMNEQIDELTEYKDKTEGEQKSAVIDSYSELLSEDILEKYRENSSNYTVTDLDKELAYELKKTNVSVFSNQNHPQYVPKDDSAGGIEGLLSKYKK